MSLISKKMYLEYLFTDINNWVYIKYFKKYLIYIKEDIKDPKSENYYLRKNRVYYVDVIVNSPFNIKLQFSFATDCNKDDFEKIASLSSLNNIDEISFFDIKTYLKIKKTINKLDKIRKKKDIIQKNKQRYNLLPKDIKRDIGIDSLT
jgi:hypothetical protein